MKLAFNISPLQTGHKFRGTGYYTLHLKNALEKYFPQHQYTFFVEEKDIPKDVDVIHYPYFDPFSLSVPLIQPSKTIVTVLDLTPIIFPKSFPSGIKGSLKWQVQKRSLKKIAGILTDSNSAKNDIQQKIHVNPKKITVAYLAAGENFRKISNIKYQSASWRTSIQKKYNLPEKFALYVGDVTWNKNVPGIIKAITKGKIPLVMVGKALMQDNFDRNNTWNKDLVMSQELLKDNNNIYRLGFVSDEDLVLLYNVAACLVMPSFYEGFGLPILEAFACGCPVITSREGSLPEVAGEAAYIVDAYSIDSIASGIKEVFTDAKLQKRLSEKGLLQAQLFSWKKTSEDTMQAYEKIYTKK